MADQNQESDTRRKSISAKYSEAEDQAGAEVDQCGCRYCDVATGPDGCTADGGQRTVADLDYAKVDMTRQGVIDSAGDQIIHLANVNCAGWSLAAALAD